MRKYILGLMLLIVSGISSSDYREIIDRCIESDSAFAVGDVVCLAGPIDSGTLYVFEEDFVSRNTKTVLLNSGGGTMYGGRAVADLIRSQNIDVIVPSGAKCLSACVLLLAAGDNVTVEDGAKVAVHFVYTPLDSSRISIDLDSSTQYFLMIDPTGNLYKDYKRFIIAIGIARAYEVNGSESFEKLRVFDPGTLWTSMSFMYLTRSDLINYGIL